MTYCNEGETARFFLPDNSILDVPAPATLTIVEKLHLCEFQFAVDHYIVNPNGKFFIYTSAPQIGCWQYPSEDQARHSNKDPWDIWGLLRLSEIEENRNSIFLTGRTQPDYSYEIHPSSKQVFENGRNYIYRFRHRSGYPFGFFPEYEWFIYDNNNTLRHQKIYSTRFPNVRCMKCPDGFLDCGDCCLDCQKAHNQIVEIRRLLALKLK